jgi:hypothetical protein
MPAWAAPPDASSGTASQNALLDAGLAPAHGLPHVDFRIRHHHRIRPSFGPLTLKTYVIRAFSHVGWHLPLPSSHTPGLCGAAQACHREYCRHILEASISAADALHRILSPIADCMGCLGRKAKGLEKDSSEAKWTPGAFRQAFAKNLIAMCKTILMDPPGLVEYGKNYLRATQSTHLPGPADQLFPVPTPPVVDASN